MKQKRNTSAVDAMKFPKCYRCGKPVKDFISFQDNKVCIKCSKQLEKCSICGIPLVRDYCTYPGDIRKFCTNCIQYRNKCDICQKPLTNKYTNLIDNRSICSICMQTAIKTESSARIILKKIFSFAKTLGLELPHKTSLKMVDSKTLMQVRKKHQNVSGEDIRAMGLFLKIGSKYDVYIENYLPYALCLRVMAHEYTHAWQADYFPSKVNLLWIEGFAEWFSYRTLIYYGYDKYAVTIPRQKDVYGKGFRKVLNIEKKQGIYKTPQKILDIVKKRAKL